MLLLYADNLLQWMTGDSDGGINGFGGDRADVGFVGDDSSNDFFLPASNTSAVLDLDETTNTGVGGVWLFRVNGSVERPSELPYGISCVLSIRFLISSVVNECDEGLSDCDSNAECTDLAMGFECMCLPGYTGDGVSCNGEPYKCVRFLVVSSPS